MLMRLPAHSHAYEVARHATPETAPRYASGPADSVPRLADGLMRE